MFRPSSRYRRGSRSALAFKGIAPIVGHVTCGLGALARTSLAVNRGVSPGVNSVVFQLSTGTSIDGVLARMVGDSTSLEQVTTQPTIQPAGFTTQEFPSLGDSQCQPK